MKLYHYTSFENFLSIWIDQALRFSDCAEANDIFESYRLKSATNIDNWKLLDKQLSEYRQISFTRDFRDGKDGYMSPMLWGYYGDKNRGVCIELESKKINIPKEVVRKRIRYVKSKQDIFYDKSNSEGISEFIRENIFDIFFTKLDDWRAENEYRFICNNTNITSLNIAGAITAVYITWRFHKDGYMGHNWNRKCMILEKFVGDHELIREFFYRVSVSQGDSLYPTSGRTKKNRETAEANAQNSSELAKKLKLIQL